MYFYNNTKILFSFFTGLTFVWLVQKEWRDGMEREETAGALAQIKAVYSKASFIYNTFN